MREDGNYASPTVNGNGDRHGRPLDRAASRIGRERPDGRAVQGGDRTDQA